MSGNLSFIVKILVSVLLIGWLLWAENPVRVWELASHANVPLLIAAFTLYLAAISAGAYKWGLLLAAQGVHVPLWHLIRFTFLGLFFGNFLPSNVGGDVVRAFDLARYTENGALASASVIVDRLVGLMVFIASAVVLGVIAVLWLGAPELMQVTWVSMALFFGCLAVFVALISRRVSRQGGFLFKLVPQLNPLKASAKRIAEAFNAYRRHLDSVFWCAVVSAVIQALTSIVNWLVAISLGLDIPFSYVFVFNPLIAMVLLLPISINGIGFKQAVYIFFYATLAGRVSEGEALTLSLLMHTIIIGAGLLGGVFWLQRRANRSALFQSEVTATPGVKS